MFHPAITTILIRLDDERRYAEAEQRFRHRLAAARNRPSKRPSIASRIRASVAAIGGRTMTGSAESSTVGCCEPASCESA